MDSDTETMNVAVPTDMKDYVRNRVSTGGYNSVSEYVRELIRRDQKEEVKAALEAEILKGLQSGEPSPMTDDDWEGIRTEVKKRYAKRKKRK